MYILSDAEPGAEFLQHVKIKRVVVPADDDAVGLSQKVHLLMPLFFVEYKPVLLRISGIQRADKFAVHVSKSRFVFEHMVFHGSIGRVHIGEQRSLQQRAPVFSTSDQNYCLFPQKKRMILPVPSSQALRFPKQMHIVGH